VTASIREEVVLAAMARLNTGPPSGVPATTRTREAPYQPSELPAMTVKSLREESETKKEGRWSYFMGHTFTLRVEFYVAGDAADSLVDPLYTWAVQSLEGQQFGGLIEDCVERLMEWEYADQDHPYAKATLDFVVLYNTIKSDPTRAT
jgi:hypothetical protein